MISPEQIKLRAVNKYKEYLIAVLKGEYLFPLIIPASKGSTRDDFVKRKIEAENLYNNSKTVKKFGYSVETEQVKTEKKGLQTVIKRIFFETEQDFVKFIKKEKESIEFRTNIKVLHENIHTDKNIDEWIEKNILLLTASPEANYWYDICVCTNWFLQNETDEYFVREIPVQVHTKFIEQNRDVIFSLYCFLCGLDRKEFKTVQEINLKLKIKTPESFIRFRLLNGKINTNLFSQNINTNEMILAVETFSGLSFDKIQNIFIIENLLVYLTFPEVKDSLCIFGSGFSSMRLEKCKNLCSKRIYYFGDIDEHGL